MSIIIDLPDEAASMAWAQVCARTLNAPFVLSFSGEIGAGKTTIIRALLRDLGVTGPIKSPTFSLVESYDIPQGLLHHFDLYRIHEISELEAMGFRDYFTVDAICCIEWPERVPQGFIPADVTCTLVLKGEGRTAVLQAATDRGAQWLLSWEQQS